MARKAQSKLDKDLDYIHLVFCLQNVKRAGWVRNKIPNPQSVSEHSFGTAALAFEFGKFFPQVNRQKLFRMAVFHDFGEAATGKDVVAERWKVYDKNVASAKAFQEAILLKRRVPLKVYSAWVEYEAQKTPEAKALREIEKLEMAVQAFIYEEKTGKDLTEFFVSASTWIKNRELLRIFNAILKKRKKRFTLP